MLTRLKRSDESASCCAGEVKKPLSGRDMFMMSESESLMKAVS